MSEENVLPSYVTDPTQVGNKVWRLIPGDGIKIDKTTTSSIDTYTFSANVSNEEGNVIEVRDDGLYIPEVTSKVSELNKSIEELRAKLDKLKEREYRSTESVYFSTSETEVSAHVVVSNDPDNCLELKADGIYCKSMDLTPGSVDDIKRRLSLLETELDGINKDIDNLKTSAYVSSTNVVTPPIVD